MNRNDATLTFDLNNRFVSTKEYANGLARALNDLAPYLSAKQRKNLCFQKLGLKSDNVSEEVFLQGAVEVSVCVHFARFFPEHFIYEEKVSPPKDVDCSFQVGDYKFNIEVKCADFSKKHIVDSSPGFKIGALGRVEEYNEVASNLESMFSIGGDTLLKQIHMDNKLKDYLASAQEKFATHTPDSELNVLVVGCDDAHDMQKWHSYLYGSQGLFTPESYADTAAYDRVDLVLLTNLFHRHKDPVLKNKLTDHWFLSEAFCILCENPTSLKPYETFLEFSKTIRHHNNELSEHLSEQSHDIVASGLPIVHYVGSKLQANGIYYFQP